MPSRIVKKRELAVALSGKASQPHALNSECAWQRPLPLPRRNLTRSQNHAEDIDAIMGIDLVLFWVAVAVVVAAAVGDQRCSDGWLNPSWRPAIWLMVAVVVVCGCREEIFQPGKDMVEF